ncbi:MAG: immunoglobulin domain-containing protein [Verrucomicrobiales bacterium]|nr:immunoglobulin domain-containing protein [Verrucomicrobiales bacterium]
MISREITLYVPTEVSEPNAASIRREAVSREITLFIPSKMESVTGPREAISREVTLDAGMPDLTISLHPQSLTRISGQSAEFSVSAAGPPPPRYQWRHNGYDIANATNAVLNIGAVSAAEAGVYTVEVTNLFRRLVSEPAILTVLVPPRIAIPPQALSVRAGTPAEFTVTAEGTPPLTFAWLRNDQPINAPSTNRLVLINPSAADSGSIRVRVTNEVGSVTSDPVELRVLATAQFVRQPVGTTLNPSERLSLNVEATGTEPFVYQWRLNGQDIPGATNAVYVVPSVTLEHAGTYTVVVANVAGASTSEAVEIIVRVARQVAGDGFAQAQPLTEPNREVGDSNATASVEPGEPDHAGKPSQRSVWYRWTASANGHATFQTVGSAFDTLLAIYTGDRVNALTEVASNDDLPTETEIDGLPRGGFFTSEITFSTTAGTTYMIALASFGEVGGNYVLSWQFVLETPAVPRIIRHPSSQTAPAGSRVELQVDVENPATATIEWWFNGEPLAGVSGTPLIRPALETSQVGTYLAVISGGGQQVFSHPAVVEIGPDRDVRTYDKFEELGVGGVPQGAVGLQAVGGGPPTLAVSAGTPITQEVNNEIYTTEFGENNHCDRIVRRTGWLTLEAQQNGYLVITARSPVVPIVMALYDGDKRVGCSENQALVFPGAIAGHNYYLAYGSGEDTGGPISLDIIAGVPPPEPSSNVAASTMVVKAGDGLILKAPPVTGIAPEPNITWLHNGRLISGAVGIELQLTNLSSASAGKYSVQFTNAIGRAVYLVAEVEVDVPFQTVRDSIAFVDGVFQFSVLGNPGQRIAIDRSAALGAQPDREEQRWLPDDGLLTYPERVTDSLGFYRAWEVPLGLADVKYTDGRVEWRVIGGRLGSQYRIEASPDGQLWTPFMTNAVQTRPFHFTQPAGDARQFQLQPLP